MSTTEFPESFTLELRARHFRKVQLNDCRNCPVSNAMSQQFKPHECTEGVDTAHIFQKGREPVIYEHEEYWGQFQSDLELATSHNFDDTIIRTIKMTRA